MESIFFQSILLQPPTILGRPMCHLSAFHVMVLQSSDSPFLIGGPVAEEDVIFFLWLCGTAYQDRASLFEEDGIKEASEWGNAVGPEWVFSDVVAEIEHYIDAYTDTPHVWSKPSEGKTRTSGIPGAFKVVADVLSHYPGISEDEAWSMPFCRAACYRASIAEDNGANIRSELQQAIFNRRDAKTPEDHAHWEAEVKRLGK